MRDGLRARAELAAVAMQRASLEAGTDRLTLDDINAEIDVVRKSPGRSARRARNRFDSVEIDAKGGRQHDS